MSLTYQIFRLIDKSGKDGITAREIIERLGVDGRTLYRICTQLGQKKIINSKAERISENVGRERHYRYMALTHLKESELYKELCAHIDLTRETSSLVDGESASASPALSDKPQFTAHHRKTFNTTVQNLRRRRLLQQMLDEARVLECDFTLIRKFQRASNDPADASLDRKTLDRLAESLENDGLAQRLDVQVPLLKGGLVCKTLLLHPLVSQDDPQIQEITAKLRDRSIIGRHVQMRELRFDPQLRIDRVQPRASRQPNPSAGSLIARRALARDYGWVVPKMMRARLFHQHIWERVLDSTARPMAGVPLKTESNVNSQKDDLKTACDLRMILREMPLCVYLQLFGVFQSLPMLDEFLASDPNAATVPMQELPQELFGDLLGRLFRRERVRQLLEVLQALRLIEYVDEHFGPLSDSPEKPDALSFQTFDASLPSWFLVLRDVYLFDLTSSDLQIYGCYRLNTVDDFNQFWIELEATCRDGYLKNINSLGVPLDDKTTVADAEREGKLPTPLRGISTSKCWQSRTAYTPRPAEAPKVFASGSPMQSGRLGTIPPSDSRDDLNLFADKRRRKLASLARVATPLAKRRVKRTLDLASGSEAVGGSNDAALESKRKVQKALPIIDDADDLTQYSERRLRLNYSAEEDELLRCVYIVQMARWPVGYSGPVDWDWVLSHMPGKTKDQLRRRLESFLRVPSIRDALQLTIAETRLAMRDRAPDLSDVEDPSAWTRFLDSELEALLARSRATSLTTESGVDVLEEHLVDSLPWFEREFSISEIQARFEVKPMIVGSARSTALVEDLMASMPSMHLEMVLLCSRATVYADPIRLLSTEKTDQGAADSERQLLLLKSLLRILLLTPDSAYDVATSFGVLSSFPESDLEEMFQELRREGCISRRHQTGRRIRGRSFQLSDRFSSMLDGLFYASLPSEANEACRSLQHAGREIAFSPLCTGGAIACMLGMAAEGKLRLSIGLSAGNRSSAGADCFLRDGRRAPDCSVTLHTSLGPLAGKERVSDDRRTSNGRVHLESLVYRSILDAGVMGKPYSAFTTQSELDLVASLIAADYVRQVGFDAPRLVASEFSKPWLVPGTTAAPHPWVGLQGQSVPSIEARYRNAVLQCILRYPGIYETQLRRRLALVMNANDLASLLNKLVDSGTVRMRRLYAPSTEPTLFSSICEHSAESDGLLTSFISFDCL